jgi:hypothetical protein
VDSSDQQALTCGVIERLELDVSDLWHAQLAAGGTPNQAQFLSYCLFQCGLDSWARDAVSLAINEMNAGQGLLLRVPYSFDLDTTPTSPLESA